MKKNTILTIILIALIFSGLSIMAQAPEAIKYQAKARDSQGNLIINTMIGGQITILKGSDTGPVVYKETHAALANNFGIIHFNIGLGLPVTGDFSQIDWGADEYFVEVAIDINGGTNYTVMGTSQLMSVPYALYAKYAGNGGGGSGGDPQCLSVSETGDTLYISDCNWVIVPGISAANHGGSSDIVYDYDGNAYDIVVIGQQTWLKQSLRSEHDATGNTINGAWDYQNNASNSSVYGKLYDWESAMNGEGSSNSNPSGVQGICPDGWHIPSKAEFEELITYLGGIIQSGKKMKETGTTYWDPPNSGATNESGFSARGAGRRGVDGSFDFMLQQNFIWMATQNNSSSAYNLTLYNNQNGAMTHTNNKDSGFSVRCLKD
jgi:uncharacterized protein (TIGR02145 family)